MRLHRFYTTEKIEAKTSFDTDVRPREIEITDERIVHQVRNVFRLGVGDKVILFNGEGVDFESEITDVSKSNLKVKILNSRKVYVPEKKITLFISIIKKENFELVCEKVTELGATSIVPVITERTLQKNLNRERIEKILVEASEQCGRGDVPVFGEETKLEKILNEENIFVCDMGGESFGSLKLIAKSQQLLIGPEGGWTEEERKMFKEKNLKIVSLGKTVLRAETAAIVGVAFLTNSEQK